MPYAVDPYTGNVYDEIGHSLITNLFMDKDKIEILSIDEILRLLSEKIITNKPENSNLYLAGFHKGYVLVTLAIQKKNKKGIEILRKFKIDSITGDVWNFISGNPRNFKPEDYKTKEYLGNLRE